MLFLETSIVDHYASLVMAMEYLGVTNVLALPFKAIVFDGLDSACKLASNCCTQLNGHMDKDIPLNQDSSKRGILSRLLQKARL